jgi:predicted transcriptional regulator
MEDLTRIADYLAIPVSELVRQAEGREKGLRVSMELEVWLCADPRRVVALLMLNSPRTIDEFVNNYGIPRVVVQGLISRLQREGLIRPPQNGYYELTQRAKKFSFRNSAEFYAVKERMYLAQSAVTQRRSFDSSGYWDDKDDSFLAVRLTPSQARHFVKKLDELQGELRTVDSMKLLDSETVKELGETKLTG